MLSLMIYAGYEGSDHWRFFFCKVRYLHHHMHNKKGILLLNTIALTFWNFEIPYNFVTQYEIVFYLLDFILKIKIKGITKIKRENMYILIKSKNVFWYVSPKTDFCLRFEARSPLFCVWDFDYRSENITNVIILGDWVTQSH